MGELGAAISADYAGREPVLVGVLNGAAVLVSDLSRALAVPHELALLGLASYAPPRRGEGGIRLLLDVDLPLAGRDVLVVDDLVETGLTLRYVVRTLRLRGPRDLGICVLLDLPYRRLVDDLPLRYVGFTGPDERFVGYGIDVAGRGRAHPDLAIVRLPRRPSTPWDRDPARRPRSLPGRGAPARRRPAPARQALRAQRAPPAQLAPRAQRVPRARRARRARPRRPGGAAHRGSDSPRQKILPVRWSNLSSCRAASVRSRSSSSARRLPSAAASAGASCTAEPRQKDARDEQHAQNRERRGERERDARHEARAATCDSNREASRRCSRASGHMVTIDPSRKTSPPSQIRLTSGLTIAFR